MSAVKSTRLLSRGKVTLKKTKAGLLVTSTGHGKNAGIYYVFNVKPNTSYVVTLTGRKIKSASPTILAIWSGKSAPISCKRVFTTTNNTFGHMIPHKKGSQLCIGVLFQSASVGDSFLLTNLTLMSRSRRKTVKFNTLKAKKRARARPTPRPAPRKAPAPAPAPRRQTEPNIATPVAIPRSNTLSGPIDLEKIRQIAARERSPSISSEVNAGEKDAISHLTQQLEKLSRLKSDMEENFAKMFDDQRSRIKRLEVERKSMKARLSLPASNGSPSSSSVIPVRRVKGDRESDSEEFYGSMSASMDMFPSLEMGESIDSIPALEFQPVPLDSPENSSQGSP
jgi:hypothetical protein